MIAALLLLLIIPQLTGTAQTAVGRGDIKRDQDLDGRVIGAVSGSEPEKLSREMWQSSEIKR